MLAVMAAIAAIAMQGSGAPPTPVGDASAWFSEADYPLDARSRGEQGRTAIRVVVDADGRATGCLVIAPSGSASLDATTCAIVIKVGRFAPARDASGRAVASTWSRTVNWVLPARNPVPRQTVNQVVTLRIGADDTLRSCETLMNGSPPQSPTDDGCTMFRNAPAYVYRGLKGRYAAGAATVTLQNLLQYAVDQPVAEPHRQAGAELLALRRETFRVLPDGTIADRQTVETGGTIGAPPAMPEDMLGRIAAAPGRSDEVTLLSVISATPAG